MEILKVENLYKSFDGREALDDISFEVHEGEFLSILGPSGCGKTTLLRILIGLLEPDKGTLIKIFMSSIISRLENLLINGEVVRDKKK